MAIFSRRFCAFAGYFFERRARKTRGDARRRARGSLLQKAPPWPPRKPFKQNVGCAAGKVYCNKAHKHNLRIASRRVLAPALPC